MTNIATRGIAALLAFTLGASALADTIRVRSNTVIPIVLEDDLSFKENREGDRFSARVDEDRDLPSGTRLEGRIINIEAKKGDKPAFMDVEFDSMVLPDGTSVKILAVPTSLDGKYVSKDRDGRLTAKKDAIRKDQYVFGGLIGGAILGSILGRKTFEGAFAGALAGIILAETSGKNGSEVALKAGTRMGALFERDVEVNFNERWDDRLGDPDRRTDSYENRLPRDDYRSNAIEVEFDGKPLRYGRTEVPYRLGGTTMVPLERTASQLGFEVERTGKAILIEDDETMIKLEQDSDRYRLNGRRGTLPRNVAIRDGVLYVPVELFAAAKGEAIFVNGTRVKSN